MEEERGKLLKAVWNLKREVFQLLTKQHCKNITVVSPMEVLGVKDSVEGVRSIMSDGVHLNKDALDKVVDHVIQGAEELFVKKKRGPTERAGPAEKKPRVASSSSLDGGRGGHGGVGRGGCGGFGRGRRGKGSSRQFFSYSSY